MCIRDSFGLLCLLDPEIGAALADPQHADRIGGSGGQSGLTDGPVSYTHLDVYKRQAPDGPHPAQRGRPCGQIVHRTFGARVAHRRGAQHDAGDVYKRQERDLAALREIVVQVVYARHDLYPRSVLFDAERAVEILVVIAGGDVYKRQAVGRAATVAKSTSRLAMRSVYFPLK